MHTWISKLNKHPPLPRKRGMFASLPLSPKVSTLQELAPAPRFLRRRLPGFIGPVPPPLLIRAYLRIHLSFDGNNLYYGQKDEMSKNAVPIRWPSLSHQDQRWCANVEPLPLPPPGG